MAHLNLHPYSRFLAGFLRSACAIPLLGLTAIHSAQACGFTGGAGLESMIRMDDPLDILLLSVIFGACCALLPAMFRWRSSTTT